jgi:hypothetical protein
MKKTSIILYLLFLFVNINAYGQNNVLYLIFDKDTPDIQKDISKYTQDNEPFITTVGVLKGSTPWSYLYTYPLVGGGDLVLRKKLNTNVQTILLSDVGNYPAKTIQQLDQEMQPLVQYDFDHVEENEYQHQTFRYFLRLNKFYVIELDKPNQLAYIVEVDFQK